MTAEGEAAASEAGPRPVDIRAATLADRVVLVSVIAGAFARRRGSRWTRPAWWVVYALLGAVDLTIKEAVCDSDRRAVLCWTPSGSRRETVAGVVLGISGVAVVSVGAVASGAESAVAHAGWAEVIALVAVLLVGLAAMVRASRPRRSAAASRPAGAWFVSSLASAVPGAGGALLLELCRRADAAGHLLCLNAPVGPLTDRYYPLFGFEVDGPPVGAGGRIQVMVRRLRQQGARRRR